MMFSHMQLDLAKHPPDVRGGAEYTAALKDCFTGFLWTIELLSKDAEAVAIWVHKTLIEEGHFPEMFVNTGT